MRKVRYLFEMRETGSAWWWRSMHLKTETLEEAEQKLKQLQEEEPGWDFRIIESVLTETALGI